MRMAVVMKTNNGCILDHDRAITDAYKSCILPTFSPLSTSCSGGGREVLDPHITHIDHVSKCSDVPGQLVRVNGVSEHLITMPEHTVSVTSEFEHSVTGESQHTVSVTSVPEHVASELPVAEASEHSDLESRNNTEQVQTLCSAVTVTKDAAESCCSLGSKEPPVDGHLAKQCCETTSTCAGISRLKTEQNTKLRREDEDSSSSGGDKLTVRIRCPPVISPSSSSSRKHPQSTLSLRPLLTFNKNQITNCECSGEAEGTDLLCSDKNSSDVSSATPSRRFMSLKLKHGFFAVNVPYMMDSQFESVNRHFLQEEFLSSHGGKIGVEDIQQVLSNKRKRKKVEKKMRSSEEDRLHDVQTSLTLAAREHGIFLQCIPLPLDNNLLSRQCAQLDHHGDVFTDLLVMGNGSPMFHEGDSMEPLLICADSCAKFSAPELLHRRVCHKSTEASVVDIDGTSYVLPPCSEFLLSNLQDFCDHLYFELADGGYDLIVLDPPWENKSVKRKKSYDMMNEGGLQDLPVARLARPGCLVALWVTNNDRLKNFSLQTLFPAWALSDVARWHWIKVTQTGDLISSMEDGHKKPYEILLVGRFSSSNVTMGEKMEELPKSKVLISVPCSLHSKKPPLAEVLRPYLPRSPRCLELFARNLWPGWASWGREALKHQNMVFFEEIQQQTQQPS